MSPTLWHRDLHVEIMAFTFTTLLISWWAYGIMVCIAGLIHLLVKGTTGIDTVQGLLSIISFRVQFPPIIYNSRREVPYCPKPALIDDILGVWLSNVWGVSLHMVSSPIACSCGCKLEDHDDVIKWKHFPCYWPFVRGIHRSPVNSPHKGLWRGA